MPAYAEFQVLPNFDSVVSHSPENHTFSVYMCHSNWSEIHKKLTWNYFFKELDLQLMKSTEVGLKNIFLPRQDRLIFFVATDTRHWECSVRFSCPSHLTNVLKQQVTLEVKRLKASKKPAVMLKRCQIQTNNKIYAELIVFISNVNIYCLV